MADTRRGQPQGANREFLVDEPDILEHMTQVVYPNDRNVLSSARVTLEGRGYPDMASSGSVGGRPMIPPLPGYVLPDSPPALYWWMNLINEGVLAPPPFDGSVQLNQPAVYDPATGTMLPAWQVPNLVSPQPGPWDAQAFLGYGAAKVLS